MKNENFNKTLKELDPIERNKIIEAFVGGLPVERFVTDINISGEALSCWKDVNGPFLDFSCVYRVPERQTMFNWEHAHPKLKYLFYDIPSREWILTNLEPDNPGHFHTAYLYSNGPDKLIIVSAKSFASFKPGTCAPEDSLVMRPESKDEN